MLIYLLVTLIVFIFVAEVLIPIARGGRLFPSFRKDPLEKAMSKSDDQATS